MASLGNLLIAVGADLSAFNAAMGDLDTQLADAEKSASKSWSGFEALSGRLKDVGTSLTASITLPLVAIGTASAMAFSGFEASLNKVAALADGITKESLAKLHDQAIKLGADTQFSAKQAADGMAELAAAGYNAEQVMKAMPGMLALAAAGQLSIAEASTVATDAIAQFGLKIDDTQRVANVLAKAAAAGKDSVSGIGTAMSYAGANAHSAGLSLEETAAALTVLANAGNRGEKAGTRLNEILIHLSTGKADKAIEALGISVKDTGDKLLPFADIVQKLSDAHITLKDAAKIAGAEGAAGLLSLVNAGGPALRKLTEDITNAHTAAADMAKTLNSGLNGAIEQMKGSIETAGIALGEALAPALIKVAGFIQEAANKAAEFAGWFGKLPEPVKEAAIVFATLAAAVGPVLFIVGQLGTAIVGINAAFVLLSPAVAALASAEMFPAITAAVTEFATVAVPAAITAVGELAVAMVAQAETSITRFATVSIPAAVTALGEFAVTAIPSAIAAITTFATVTIPAAVASLVTFATTSVPAATASLVEMATAGVAGAVESLGKLAASALPAATTALAVFGVAAATAAAAFAGWKLGEWAYNAFAPVKKLGDALSDLIQKIPGVTFVIEKLSGASDAQARAASDQAFANQKLAESQAKAKTAAKDHSTATDKLKTSVQQAKDEVEKAARAHKEAAISIKDHTDKSSLLFQTAKILRDEHEKHVKALAELKLKYGDLSTVIPELIQPSEELNKLIDEQATKTTTAKDAIALWGAELKRQMSAAEAPIKAVDEAFKTLGITSSTSLQEQAAKAAQAYETIRQSGTATANDINAAFAKMEDARLKAAVAAGTITKEEAKKALDGIKSDLDESVTTQTKTWTDFGKTIGTAWDDITKDISQAFDGLISGSIKDLIGGKGFSGLIDAGKRLGESLLSDLIKPFENSLSDLMSGVIKDLMGGKGFGGILDSVKSLGSSIAGIFGGGVKAAGDAAGAAGQAAGQAAGAAGSGAGSAGSAASAASSGITGVLGAVFSGVSAASGIFGNFQNAQLEKGINAIEESTRYTMIYTGKQDQSILWSTQTTAERLNYVNDSLDTLKNFALDWLQPLPTFLADAVQQLHYAVPRLDQIGDSVTWGSASEKASESILADIRDAARNDSLGREQINLLQQIRDAVRSGAGAPAAKTLGAAVATQGVVFV